MTSSAPIATGSRRRRRILNGVKAAVSYVVLLFIGLVMLVPFIWMLSTSLKKMGEVFLYPPVWIPRPAEWANYLEVAQRFPFVRWFVNSAYIAALATLGQLLTCSLAAYAFARFEFPARNVIFSILLATMMVPSQVTLIPQFVVMYRLGLMDKHIALWGPAFFGGAFGTFLLRQYFLTLPNELEDAAWIDGATSWGFYWRILLPLSKPALATLGLFVFMGQWNNLMGPVMYLTTREKMTLPFGLALLRGQPGWGATPWHLVMAGAVMTLLPILILFGFTQKYYVQGIVMTGLKL